MGRLKGKARQVDLQEGTGVFVLGMHRSGTSAATRVVNLLGVPLGDLDDLMIAGSPENPKGHWESESLTAFNEKLLQRLGGAWSAPPPFADGWVESIPEELRDDGARTFRSVYGSTPWVWKDPRNCLTLPFWLDLLSERPICIVVIRHPLDVAASLRKRNGFPTILGLALWERYIRDLLANVVGLPVLISRFDDLLNDLGAWCTNVIGFLRQHGVMLGPSLPKSVNEFLDVRLVSHRALDPLSPSLSASRETTGLV